MIPLFFNPATEPPRDLPAGARRLRILAITRKPESASFTQRVLRYIEPLAALGIDVEYMTLSRSIVCQWRELARGADYDAIWWHRHMLSLWSMPRLSRIGRPLVFDFDDPLPFSSEKGGRPSASRRIRFAGMLRRCSLALAASEHLAQLAQPFCSRVLVHPMAIDLPESPPLERPPGPEGALELLWLGSASTQPFLAELRPLLEEVGQAHPGLRLRLVGHEPMPLTHLPVDFRKWSACEEQAALRECHIGLCPMPDTPWTRGKCPYKVLQYMAYGMPWVGSAVGENLTTAGGENADEPRGLCAADSQQWRRSLEELVQNAELRRNMGQAARRYIAQHHDRAALTQRLASIWHGLTTPV